MRVTIGKKISQRRRAKNTWRAVKNVLFSRVRGAVKQDVGILDNAFLVGIQKAYTALRVAYLETMYKIHLRIRFGHDIAYKNVKVYKDYSDGPASKVIHKTVVWAFIASFATFTFLQYLAPELFNFATPNKVYAGSDSVSWDSNTQFSAAENDGNLAINGLENASFFKVKNSSVFNFGNGSDGKLVVDGTTVTIDKPEGGAVEYTRTPATDPTLFEGSAYIINLDSAIGGGLNQYYFSTVELKNSAIITHSLGATGSGGVQGIELYATGSITVSANSKIDVSGKGNNPLGKSTTSSTLAAPGGSYGGVGGTGYGGTANSVYPGRPAYGTAAGVEYFGAMGRGQADADAGQYGGGRIKISSDTVILNGAIQANGKAATAPGTYVYGGGSGGGIYIAASQLTYTNYISAAGAGGDSYIDIGKDGLNGIGGNSRDAADAYGCWGGNVGVGGNGGNGALRGTPLVCSNGGFSAGAGTRNTNYTDFISAGGGAAGRIAIYYGTVNGGVALISTDVQETSTDIIKSGTWNLNNPSSGLLSTPLTYAAGNSLSYTFTGLGKIKWVGAKHSYGGKADVILTEQGQSPQTTIVDTFSTVESCVGECYGPVCSPVIYTDQLLYESGALDRTKTYTLQIVQRPDKNALSEGNYVIFDRLITYRQDLNNYSSFFINTTSTPGVIGPYAYYTNVAPYLSSATLGGANTASGKIGLRNDVGKKVRWNSISMVGTVPVGTTVKFLGRFSDTLGTGDFVNPQTKVKDVWSTTIPPGTYTSANPAVIDISSQELLSSTIELYVALTAGSDSPTIDTVIANYDTLESPLNTNTSIKKTNDSPLKNSSGNEVAAGIPGGLTNETGVKVVTTGLTCTSCATPINNPYIEVEYKPTGSIFTGTSDIITGAVDGGNVSTATLTGLTAGTGYHLQMRTKDAAGRVSGWTSYGDNAESQADFTIDQYLPTVSTTGWKTKTNTTISQVGGIYYATSQDIKLSITATDNGGSNLATAQLSNDGTNWGSVTVANGTDSLPNTADDVFTYVPNGTYTISTSSYTGDLPWQLTTGDAAKPVYVRVSDNAGNGSGGISHNIESDFAGTLGTSVLKTGGNITLSSDSYTSLGTQRLATNYNLDAWGDIFFDAGPIVNNAADKFRLIGSAASGSGYITVFRINVNGSATPVSDYIDGTAYTPSGSQPYYLLAPAETKTSEWYTGQSVVINAASEASNLNYLDIEFADNSFPVSGTYTSQPISNPALMKSINWSDSTTGDYGGTVTTQVRGGNDINMAGATAWSANIAKGGAIPDNIKNKPYIQYLLTLSSGVSQTKTPIVYDVSLESAAGTSITLDLTPPAQVSSITGYSVSDPGTRVTLDPSNPAQWYEYASPYFDWTANADADIAGYKYCFGLNTCTPTTTLATHELTMDLTNTTNYPDKIYYLRVIGYDLAGNESTTVTQYTYRLDRTRPGAVTNYSATQNNETTITVNWQAVSAGGGSNITYVLERIPYITYITDGYSKEDVGPDKIWSNLETYKAFAPTSAISITESVTDDLISPNRLIGGVKYVYRIRAYDETGKFSDLQNSPFFGLTRDGTNPTPPTGVSAAACSYQAPENCETTNDNLKGHQITVRWSPGTDAGTGIIAYEVHRAMTNETLEASYELLATIPVTNPLPVMDEYTTLVYRDNNLTDYTTYHYRIVAVDAAADATFPANKSRIVENISNFANYASTNTPDVTPPTTPVVTVNAGSLDSSNEHQKMIISWPLSTDTGIGNMTYKLYKANRADSTEQSSTLTDGDFVDYTNNANVACETIQSEGIFQCVEQGLLDYTWYYYRATATDGSPYNNTTAFSATAYAKTLSSSVPSPPRGRKDPETQVYESYPYTYATKGDPTITGSTVGKEIKITFTGSYEKDCVLGPNVPCLVKYEVYRRASTEGTWSKVGDDITPIRIDNDMDNQYIFTDSTVASETLYYYQVRAVGNNPDIPLADNTTASGIGSAKYQGWDIVPDIEGPILSENELQVLVRDTHPNEFELRNIVTWKMLTDTNMPKRNGVSDFYKYEVHREVVDPNTGAVISDTKAGDVTNIGDNYLVDILPIAFADLKYKYYIVVVDNAGSDYKYSNGDYVNEGYSNTSSRQYWIDAIIPSKATPTVVGAVTLSDINVTTANIGWTTDQDTDSLVQYRAKKLIDGVWTIDTTAAWVTIGQVERSVPHTVKLIGLLPNTQYEYKLVSRNYLDNRATYNESALPTLTTGGFNINIDSIKVGTTTTGVEISWSTNLDASSSFVEYQMQTQPGDAPQGKTVGVDPDLIVTSRRNHKVSFNGLKSQRTYNFKLKSISMDGFVAEYPIYSRDGRNLDTFATKAFDTAQFTLTPSSSNVAERNITATTAQIVWETANPATSWVDYSAITSGVYESSAGDNSYVTTHVVKIDGLIPGTKYYYRVRVKDANDIEFTSQEYTFTAVLKPKISNLRVTEIKPYSFKLAWDTNVETETLINFGKTAAYGEKRGKQGMVKSHELQVEQLEDNQEYHYQILAKDETGEEVADEDKFIRTPLDTEGPKISNVKIDVLPMGENDTTSSVIVSWQTDKPATTLVEYDEGVIGGKYSKQSVEDTSLSNSHTVIIKELQTATSYHYHLVSRDKRDNVTTSQDYTFVTPSKEKSILQLIIKSLEETFSWTRNLNQFFGNIGKRLSGSSN